MVENRTPHEYWREKISKNRVSVVRNFSDLKAKDGEVCAIWEFETGARQGLTRRLVLVLDEAAS